MKKVLAATALAAVMPQANALPLVDFYAGGYYWDQSYSGEITDSSSEVDLEDNLNLDGVGNNVFYLAFEHPIPVIPNIKVKQTSMSTEGDDGTVTASFNLGGTSFTGNASDVMSEADFSHTDFTLYWSLPLPIVTVDFGLTARQFDGFVKMESETLNQSAEADLNAVVPMLYGKVGVDIPLTGLSVGGDVNYIGLGDSGVTDYDVNLTYVLPIIPLLDVGLTAGYRSFNFEVDPDDFGGSDDDLAAEATVAGPYFGLSLHL